MEGYIRSRKIDILFFSFFSFLFKIIDRGILGVLRRTREECRFLGVVIVRFIQKARHSEDPRWRGYFPVTWKGTMDYTVKSQISSLSVYIEQNGAARLKASGFWTHLPVFFSSLCNHPANGVENFCFFPSSFLLFLKILNFVEGSSIFSHFSRVLYFFPPCEIIIYPSRFLFIRIFCIISLFFSRAFTMNCDEKKRKKKNARTIESFFLSCRFFNIPNGSLFYKFHVWKIERVVVRSRYINTPTLICETSSMAKIAVINVNSQQNKFLVCIIVMQYNWTHFKHKTEKMGYEIKEVCTQFRSKSPVLINIQIRLNAQNIIQDQHLRFYA